MGLRCSLLGHDFGDPEVEREREERGSEVVLTVREVAECSRCGTDNVVSENKEVTAIPDEGDEADRRDDTEQTSLSETAPDPSSGDESESDENETEDDAVIISDDDDDEDDGREHGEWPERDQPADEDDDDADDGPTEWPTIESDDEGFDAQPSAGGGAAVEFGGGLAPERSDVEEEDGLEYVESVEAEPTNADAADGRVQADAGAQTDAGGQADDGFVKASAAPSPAEPASADVDAEFVCPQCGFVDDVVGSSLRAGDVCPDCRRGYLSERQR